MDTKSLGGTGVLCLIAALAFAILWLTGVEQAGIVSGITAVLGAIFIIGSAALPQDDK